MTTPEQLARPLDLKAMRQQITVMRAQAEVLRRTADGLGDADPAEPAEYVKAVALATEHVAELLAVFLDTSEAKVAPPATCVCCHPGDCGDRRGHVDNYGEGLCVCGALWPCEKRETS